MFRPSLIRRRLLALAWPIIIQIYLFQLTGVIDNIMIGQFGEQTIAALSICLQLNFLIIVSYSILTQGGSVFMAQYFGAKKRSEMQQLTITLLFSAFIVGVAIAVLYWFSGKWLLSLITTDLFRPAADRSDIPLLAYEYLQVIGFGMIATAVGQVSLHLLQALGDTKSPMKYVFFCNLINVLGNFIFLFGGAIPGLTEPLFTPMGIRGVAISTVLSWSLLSLLLLIKLFRHEQLRMHWSDALKVKRDQFLKVLKVGYPLSLDGFLWQGSAFLYAMMFNRVGPSAYAAFMISLMIRSLALATGGGLQQATAIGLGQAIGSERLRRAKAFVRTGLTTAWLVLPILTAVGFLLTPLLLLLYNIETETRNWVLGMIGLGVIYSVATAVTMIVPGVLRAGGDTKAPMFITAFGFIIVGIPTAYWFGLHLGLGFWGLLIGFIADEIVKAIIMLLYLKRNTWLTNLTHD